MKTEFDFLDSPLCIWVRCVLGEASLVYEKFPTGEYFHQILKRSDPRLQHSNTNLPKEINQSSSQSSTSSHNIDSSVYDTTFRTHLLTLDFILRNIRAFYQDSLSQIILLKLPDIYQIAKHPDSEQTFKEMEKMLLLLLGLAINGEFKAKFIEQIQKLETHTQMQLVPFIQLVTDDLNFSINRQLSHKVIASNCENTEGVVEHLSEFLNGKLIPNIQRIIDERDSYLESIIELEQDKDYLSFQLNNLNNSIILNNNNTNNNKNSTNISTNNADHHTNSDLKSINDLILNLVNNSSTICKLESSSDTMLNETQIISKLIDSLMNKEIDETQANQQQMNPNDSSHTEENSLSSASSSQNNSIVRSGSLNEQSSLLLNDLKHRKSLTNNFNQKITIELVETKIKLKQLLNE